MQPLPLTEFRERILSTFYRNEAAKHKEKRKVWSAAEAEMESVQLSNLLIASSSFSFLSSTYHLLIVDFVFSAVEDNSGSEGFIRFVAGKVCQPPSSHA
jgi:hypothetical protein